MSTPMMQQYREAKERHPGMILLFRMGDFFETFEEDAELVAKVLGLTLTSRDKQIPMAGFPHHALENHLRSLLKRGHRVAICDQVEDASQAKGLVKREVTRIVTPGTITEDSLLDASQPNRIAAIIPVGNQLGVAWVEATTGELFAADFSTSALIDEISRLNLAECLVGEADSSRLPSELLAALPVGITKRPDWTFDNHTAREILFKHFGVLTVSGFGFEDQQPCLVAAGGLIHYLQETMKAELTHIRRLNPYYHDKHLRLDAVTRRSLELTKTIRDGQKDGSLLSVVDRTVTPMGARMLHDALVAPLAERQEIERRLDAVAELLTETNTRREIRDILSEVPDIQRLTTKVSTGRATPKDLAAIRRAVRLLPKLKAKIAGRKAAPLVDLGNKLELCPDLRELLDRALVDDPPYNPRDGGVIREGFSPTLDEYRVINREGKQWLANYQAEEIARTGIPTLKVGFNQVHGYFIEITNTHAAKVPDDFIRRQTLKNAERYITPKLKEYEEKAVTAQEKSLQLELDLFQQVREQIAQNTVRLLELADLLALLDFFAGLAELAANKRYVRPLLVDEPELLEIREGRHPVLDQTLPPGTLVPNDVVLTPDTGLFWLITGPNMSGKSVFIKQVALIVLLAQMGSFVPAAAAKIGLVDRIFTRVGASDELAKGHSTFMVEMTEAANILNNATASSLVILDEIGRGTSTYDGVSLAWAISEHLHDEIRCRCMFATHYHELSQLAESLHYLRNYHVQVQELDNDVVFLHKIASGSAERSYGVHVAKLAGMPPTVLERSQVILEQLESRHQLPQSNVRFVVSPPERKRKPRNSSAAGPGLFDSSTE
ncbi:MAG: DNA mismatch repair protein MutS [Zavarzinella sp.]